MKQLIGLNLESASDYRITKTVGRKRTVIGIAEARELYTSGKVDNYNLAFARLVDNDFDLEAVKAFYARKGEPSRLMNLGVQPEDNPKD